jgi:Holliday junction resolvasome RuvABC DNA-binding subunit
MSEIPTALIWDGATNTTIIRPLTPEEIAQREADAAAWAEEKAAREAEAAQKEADRQAGIAALKALGLTDAQISAMLG